MNILESINSHLGINNKQSTTAISAIILAIALLFFAFFMTTTDRVTTFIVCVSGIVAGWVIGIITSPYDKADAKRIHGFTKMIGSFFTGYVLSKSDKLFNENTLKNMHTINVLRVLLFACFFGITWAVVFVFRLYAELPLLEALKQAEAKVAEIKKKVEGVK